MLEARCTLLIHVQSIESISLTYHNIDIADSDFEFMYIVSLHGYYFSYVNIMDIVHRHRSIDDVDIEITLFLSVIFLLMVC